jgi:hypothetical protein
MAVGRVDTEAHEESTDTSPKPRNCEWNVFLTSTITFSEEDSDD